MDTLNQYQQYYLNNLKQITKLKHEYHSRSITVPKEHNSIYLLSFMGLLRENYPFEKKQKSFIDDIEIKGTEAETEDDDIKKGKQKSKKKNKKSEEEALKLSPDDPTGNFGKNDLTLIIRNGNDFYECSENALKTMFGELYTHLFEKKERSTDLNNGTHIFIPDFDMNEDVLLDKKKKKNKNEQPEKERPILPYIVNNINFPDDEPNKKSYDSFLFDEYDVQVRFPNGKKSAYKIVIYPLIMGQKDAHITDILVSAMNKADNRIRCNVSSVIDGETKRVEADFNECKFNISGSWQDDEFSSKIVLVTDVQNGQEPIMQSSLNKVRPTKKTSSYYQRIKGKNGDYLDVFPVSLINNNPSTGLAYAVTMIEDRYSRKVYLPTGNSFISTWFDGSQKDIYLYWKGNDLLCDVKETHNEE